MSPDKEHDSAIHPELSGVNYFFALTTIISPAAGDLIVADHHRHNNGP